MSKKWRIADFLEGFLTRQEQAALFFMIVKSLIGLALVGWQKGNPPKPPAWVRLQVRVNAAAAAEISALPGIGPVLARPIVEDREQHGRFLTLPDLRRVKGITPKVLERIQESVCFD